ncbi:MAG: pseudouridine synthase [Clostridia bacterium]|nr:pseudouridine synthase [Clostridia bacterium]
MTYKDINILFEDNHLLVVVKPYGVPCQADSSGDDDMLTLLKQYLKEKYNKPGDAYLGLVHRLDRPTGGVMVFAKTSKAAARLSEQIQNGDTEKRYLAVVEGTPLDKSAKLVHYLKKYGDENIVRVVPQLTEGAKYAELDYKVLESKGGYSLVMVNLVTGRGHQIRVQMATIGNPIVGDCRYGNGEKLKLPLSLWATELRFAHPISGQQMVFRVYPPDEQPWASFDIEKFLRLTIKNS